MARVQRRPGGLALRGCVRVNDLCQHRGLGEGASNTLIPYNNTINETMWLISTICLTLLFGQTTEGIYRSALDPVRLNRLGPSSRAGKRTCYSGELHRQRNRIVKVGVSLYRTPVEGTGVCLVLRCCCYQNRCSHIASKTAPLVCVCVWSVCESGEQLSLAVEQQGEP